MAGMWDYVKFIASQPDAVNQGLGTFKNYLQVENAIAKNFQDALTFNKNVDAMNAANAAKELESQQAYQKRQADALFHEDLARRLPAAQGNVATATGAMVGDNRSALYANPWNAGRLLDPNMQKLLAGQVAQQAAIDPMGAAQTAANVGLAPAGHYSQDANGNVVLKTSDGRTLMLPAAQLAYGLNNPAGQTQATHQDMLKDANDVVEQGYALDRMSHQGAINRANAAYEAALGREDAAHYNGLGYGKSGQPFPSGTGAVSAAGVDSKDVADTLVKLMQNGMDYNDALRASVSLHMMGHEPVRDGLGEQANPNPALGLFDTQDATGQPAKPEQAAKAANTGSGTGTAIETNQAAAPSKQAQFNALVQPFAPFVYQNRQDAVASANGKLKQLNDFLNGNQEYANSTIYQQAQAQRDKLLREVDGLNRMSDEVYYERANPTASVLGFHLNNPYAQRNQTQQRRQINIENFKF